MQVTIAHLSDLHAVKNQRWKDKSSTLIKVIARKKPAIALLTGDCVNFPWIQNFKIRKTFLDNLVEEVNQERKDDVFRIISTPGNHDCFFTKRWYVRMMQEHCTSGKEGYLNEYEETLKYVYDVHSIALFPIDSTCQCINFLGGRVDNAYNQFDVFKKIYSEMKGEQHYRQAFKICTMHHHPLPTYTIKKDQKREPMLMMRNAREVLRQISDFKIHLVLHGHKHDCTDTLCNPTPNEATMFAVSSCGSSCKHNVNSNSVRFHTVMGGLAERVETLYSNNRNYSTDTAPSPPINLLSHGEARKKRSNDYQNEDTFIKKTRVKHKAVQLLDTGDAYVDIWYDQIEWKEGAKAANYPLKEQLSADMGRIPGGKMGLGNNKFTALETWRRDEFHNEEDLNKTEHYTIEVHPTETGFKPTSDTCCNIAYLASNLFCLNSEQYKRVYGSAAQTYQEAASISVNHPTELLVLNLRFPQTKKQKYFPQDFIVEAVPKAQGNNTELPAGLSIIQRKYNIDEMETDFLERKNALLVRPSISECELIVRHPQPDLVYIIRWDVAKVTTQEKSSLDDMFADKEKLKLFYDELLETTTTFYSEVFGPTLRLSHTAKNQSVAFYENLVKGYLTDNLRVVLLQPKLDECCLEVEKTVSPEEFKKAKPLPIGRGPAGVAAKKLRSCHYLKKRANLDDRNNPYTPVEPIIEGLDPDGVQCFPITEGNLLHAVISLVFEKFPDKLGFNTLIDDEEVRDELVMKYTKHIWCLALKYFQNTRSKQYERLRGNDV